MPPEPPLPRMRLHRPALAIVPLGLLNVPTNACHGVLAEADDADRPVAGGRRRVAEAADQEVAAERAEAAGSDGHPPGSYEIRARGVGVDPTEEVAAGVKLVDVATARGHDSRRLGVGDEEVAVQQGDVVGLVARDGVGVGELAGERGAGDVREGGVKDVDAVGAGGPREVGGVEVGGFDAGSVCLGPAR